MKEPLITDIHSMAADLYDHIKRHSNGESFSLLGHSMGALLAYLISCLSEDDSPGCIKHVFCSAHGAPSVPKGGDEKLPRYKASSKEFWMYIESLGALPPELKAHEELMNYFEPIVRADIQALECYRYQEREKPLDISMSVLYGTSDAETPLYSLLHWQRETLQTIEFIPQTGGHFGFFDEINNVIQHLRTSLLKKG
jgi:surfactin synthase thioesterase subunit